MTRSRGVQAACVALLAALATAAWVHRIELDPHSSRVESFEVDTYRYYWPTAVFLHEELSRGHLPLWNPYQLAGQPYLALHLNALLYPPTWLLAVFSPRATFAVLSILHSFAAGLFTWLFAGRLGLGRPARVAAAAAYMLCGPLEVGFYLPPYLAAPTWLPALLWALHGLASEARARWVVGLAVFAALSFLAGHAQAFVYALEVAAAYGLFLLWRVAPPGRRLRVVGLAALAGALALGLVAPELLPSLELARMAVRSLSGLSYEEAAVSSASPPQLLRGMLRLLAPFGVGPFERMLTLPALALPLAAAAFLPRARRAHALLFAGLALLVALVMLGPHTPFFALYHRLPLGDLFRGPSRFAFAWSFLFAMLLAFGIEAVGALGRSGPVARIAAALLALAVVADAYALTGIPNAHPVRTGDYLGTAPEVIAFLRADPTRSRVFVESFDVNSTRSLDKLGMRNRVFAVPDYEPSMPAAYFEYFHPQPRQPWHGRLHLVPGRDPSRAEHLAGPRLLDLLSVRWVVLELPAPRPLVAALAEATGSTGRRIGQALLFERAGALPRAYAVRRVRSAPDFGTALAAIEAPDFDPRAEAVVTGPEAATAVPPPDPASAPAPDRANVASLEPERVVVRAECSARCLLVLTDLFYPGWHASVDGREAPILPTNAIFRGVWLEPGAHEVTFRFEPASFHWGLAIFAATLVALAAAGTTRLYARAGRA